MLVLLHSRIVMIMLLSLKVGAKDAVSVYFWIVPETLGQIPIEVKAVSSGAGDAVRRQLLVKVLLDFLLHVYSCVPFIFCIVVTSTFTFGRTTNCPALRP